MSKEAVLDAAVLAKLPPEWPEELLPTIQAGLEAAAKTRNEKVVILDDDPTGTQTVQDIPVLTSWSVEELKAELSGDSLAFFILTNSRSLNEGQACLLAEEIGANLFRAARECGVKLVLISRSDSTLRGHFPAEVDRMAAVTDQANRPYLVYPFFQEGGRYTFNDIHYVREGDTLVPAAQTPFARDAAFGFSSSNLRDWVTEKTGARLARETVQSVSIEDIRLGGPEKVAEKLLTVKPGSACVVNSVSYRDAEVVVAALLAAEQAGAEFLFRTAASFVRTRLGQPYHEQRLTSKEIVADNRNGGLFVIGSYVEKTSRQVEALFVQTDIARVMVDVASLLDESVREQEMNACRSKCEELLKAGRDVALYTSRKLIVGHNAKESLEIGQSISDGLIGIVGSISVQPRYLVAKGGITSSDVATKALKVRRAMVIGQPLPGVPAWRLGEESRYPGMVYIVFPGNVGSDEALAELKKNLESR